MHIAQVNVVLKAWVALCQACLLCAVSQRPHSDPVASAPCGNVLVTPLWAETEESVKEFIIRNLGEEVFYRLIEPFCSGVYAGDPSRLSMKAAFNQVRHRGDKVAFEWIMLGMEIVSSYHVRRLLHAVVLV